MLWLCTDAMTHILFFSVYSVHVCTHVCGFAGCARTYEGQRLTLGELLFRKNFTELGFAFFFLFSPRLMGEHSEQASGIYPPLSSSSGDTGDQ